MSLCIASPSPSNLIHDIGGYISQLDLNNGNFNRPCAEITQSIRNNEQSKALTQVLTKKRAILAFSLRNKLSYKETNDLLSMLYLFNVEDITYTSTELIPLKQKGSKKYFFCLCGSFKDFLNVQKVILIQINILMFLISK